MASAPASSAGGGGGSQAPAVALDFGSQTCRAYAWRGGRLVQVPDGSSQSVVALGDHLLAGKPAAKQLETRHPNVVRHLLPTLASPLPVRLGHPEAGGERVLEPDDLAAFLLNAQRTRCAAYYVREGLLASPPPPSPDGGEARGASTPNPTSTLAQAVVALPVAVSSMQKRRVVASGIAAGYRQVNIIPSPAAGAVYWAHCSRVIGSTKLNRRLLVVDAGCRHTSVAVVAMSCGATTKDVCVDIIKSRGLAAGGYDIDLALAGLAPESHTRGHPVLVLNAAEQAKKELASLQETTFRVKDVKRNVTRADLDACAAGVVGPTCALIRTLVMEHPDIDVGVLIGGGSRLLAIQNYVKSCGIETDVVDADFASVMGAAVIAGGTCRIHISESSTAWEYWAVELRDTNRPPVRLFPKKRSDNLPTTPDGWWILQRLKTSYPQPPPTRGDLLHAVRVGYHGSGGGGGASFGDLAASRRAGFPRTDGICTADARAAAAGEPTAPPMRPPPRRERPTKTFTLTAMLPAPGAVAEGVEAASTPPLASWGCDVRLAPAAIQHTIRDHPPSASPKSDAGGPRRGSTGGAPLAATPTAADRSPSASPIHSQAPYIVFNVASSSPAGRAGMGGYRGWVVAEVDGLPIRRGTPARDVLGTIDAAATTTTTAPPPPLPPTTTTTTTARRRSVDTPAGGPSGNGSRTITKTVTLIAPEDYHVDDDGSDGTVDAEEKMVLVGWCRSGQVLLHTTSGYVRGVEVQRLPVFEDGGLAGVSRLIDAELSRARLMSRLGDVRCQLDEAVIRGEDEDDINPRVLEALTHDKFTGYLEAASTQLAGSTSLDRDPAHAALQLQHMQALAGYLLCALDHHDNRVGIDPVPPAVREELAAKDAAVAAAEEALARQSDGADRRTAALSRTGSLHLTPATSLSRLSDDQAPLSTKTLDLDTSLPSRLGVTSAGSSAKLRSKPTTLRPLGSPTNASFNTSFSVAAAAASKRNASKSPAAVHAASHGGARTSPQTRWTISPERGPSQVPSPAIPMMDDLQASLSLSLDASLCSQGLAATLPTSAQVPAVTGGAAVAGGGGGGGGGTRSRGPSFGRAPPHIDTSAITMTHVTSPLTVVSPEAGGSGLVSPFAMASLQPSLRVSSTYEGVETFEGAAAREEVGIAIGVPRGLKVSLSGLGGGAGSVGGGSSRGAAGGGGGGGGGGGNSPRAKTAATATRGAHHTHHSISTSPQTSPLRLPVYISPSGAPGTTSPKAGSRPRAQTLSRERERSLSQSMSHTASPTHSARRGGGTTATPSWHSFSSPFRTASSFRGAVPTSGAGGGGGSFSGAMTSPKGTLRRTRTTSPRHRDPPFHSVAQAPAPAAPPLPPSHEEVIAVSRAQSLGQAGVATGTSASATPAYHATPITSLVLSSGGNTHTGLGSRTATTDSLARTEPALDGSQSQSVATATPPAPHLTVQSQPVSLGTCGSSSSRDGGSGAALDGSEVGYGRERSTELNVTTPVIPRDALVLAARGSSGGDDSATNASDSDIDGAETWGVDAVRVASTDVLVPVHVDGDGGAGRATPAVGVDAGNDAHGDAAGGDAPKGSAPAKATAAVAAARANGGPVPTATVASAQSQRRGSSSTGKQPRPQGSDASKPSPAPAKDGTTPKRRLSLVPRVARLPKKASIAEPPSPQPQRRTSIATRRQTMPQDAMESNLNAPVAKPQPTRPPPYRRPLAAGDAQQQQQRGERHAATWSVLEDVRDDMLLPCDSDSDEGIDLSVPVAVAGPGTAVASEKESKRTTSASHPSPARRRSNAYGVGPAGAPVPKHVAAYVMNGGSPAVAAAAAAAAANGGRSKSPELGSRRGSSSAGRTVTPPRAGKLPPSPISSRTQRTPRGLSSSWGRDGVPGSAAGGGSSGRRASPVPLGGGARRRKSSTPTLAHSKPAVPPPLFGSPATRGGPAGRRNSNTTSPRMPSPTLTSRTPSTFIAQRRHGSDSPLSRTSVSSRHGSRTSHPLSPQQSVFASLLGYVMVAQQEAAGGSGELKSETGSTGGESAGGDRDTANHGTDVDLVVDGEGAGGAETARTDAAVADATENIWQERLNSTIMGVLSECSDTDECERAAPDAVALTAAGASTAAAAPTATTEPPAAAAAPTAAAGSSATVVAPPQPTAAAQPASPTRLRRRPSALRPTASTTARTSASLGDIHAYGYARQRSLTAIGATTGRSERTQRRSLHVVSPTRRGSFDGSPALPPPHTRRTSSPSVHHRRFSSPSPELLRATASSRRRQRQASYGGSANSGTSTPTTHGASGGLGTPGAPVPPTGAASAFVLSPSTAAPTTVTFGGMPAQPHASGAAAAGAAPRGWRSARSAGAGSANPCSGAPPPPASVSALNQMRRSQKDLRVMHWQ